MFLCNVKREFLGTIADVKIYDQELFRHLEWFVENLEEKLDLEHLDIERQQMVVEKLISIYENITRKVSLSEYEEEIYNILVEEKEELKNCIEDESYDENLSILGEIFYSRL